MKALLPMLKHRYLTKRTGERPDRTIEADTSSGKSFYIEVRNVPLEDVLPMLETIVIG